MMKTIKNITIIALMLVSVLGYAEKRTELENRTVITKAVVDLDNVKIGQRLLVKDERGDIIYSETIQMNGDISKAINLENLRDGNYSFELEKDFEVLVTPFTIVNHEFAIDNSRSFKLFKPLVQSDDNTLKISQLSLEASPVEIEIYFSDELIYSETIENEQLIRRYFKLSKRSSGEYTSVVKANGRTFTYNFEY